LGWGALRSSVEASASAAVGNYGLMDQRLALWWSHTNAAAFGGSASKMMVFGQSAGAVSLCMHAANPSSLPPLAGVAIESGMCDSAAWLSHPNQTLSFTAALLNATNCGNLSEGGAEGQRVLACIRSLPLHTILNLLIMHPAADVHAVFPPEAVALPPLLPIMGFAPTLDGSIDGVVRSPVAAAAAGSALRVPYIIGTNQDEGSLFVCHPQHPPHLKRFEITTGSWSASAGARHKAAPQ
jgi:para-nitrobenzyl esterase